MKKQLLACICLGWIGWALQAATPLVTTTDDVVRGATVAFYWGQVQSNGAAVAQRGICHATHPEPTLDDRVVKSPNAAVRFRCRLDGLEPGTRHYVRAYALLSDKTVIYGETKTFCTVPLGTVRYTINYNRDSDPDSVNHKRIEAAVASAVDYYNRCTSIKNVHITGNYNPGTPTADCSYGGWIRFGSNASYQRTGTALHEMAHGVGVGTHVNWSNWTERKGWLIYGGVFQGKRTNQAVQLLSNGSDASVRGDNQHFWPYGINGAHEDTNSDELYLFNALLIQAMAEDGLPTSSSYNFAMPYEAFPAEEGRKYYIKNESTSQGRDTRFLALSKLGTLGLQSMTPEEALENDYAAWYISFDPQRQLYSLRNVATKKYITWAGSSFVARDSSAISSVTLRSFQFFPNRRSQPVGDEKNWLDLSGYQVVYPQQLRCMTGANAGVSAAQPILTNEVSAQRWLFLTADEVQTFAKVITDTEDEFLPDTTYYYSLKPKSQALRVKSTLHKLYLDQPNDGNERQLWRLQAVKCADGQTRYYLLNLGSSECLTLLKWEGDASSVKLSQDNAKTMVYDATNPNQQLSLTSVEVDFSQQPPVRYIAIENNWQFPDNSTTHRLDTYGGGVNERVRNCFDQGKFLDSQLWQLVEAGKVSLAPSSAPTLQIACRQGELLFEGWTESMCVMVYSLTGERLHVLDRAVPSIQVGQGVFLVKLITPQGTETRKIVSL